MINNSSSSVGTCSVSSASLSKGERRISDVQNIDKTIASIRHTDRSGELIFLALRRHKKMKKLQKLSVTLDKYNKTNNKDKRARVDKLKKDINIEIKNYDNFGVKKPPMQMIPRGTSSRPEPASSNTTTPMYTIPRVASTQTGAASSPSKVYDTDGFPIKTRDTTSRPKPAGSITPAPKAPPKTNKASGKADPRILELQVLELDLATLRENASGSGQGDRDYRNNAGRLKRRIEELEIELAATVVEPKRVTPTLSQEHVDIINDINTKIFELNNMDQGSSSQAFTYYQEQKPILKREIEVLKSRLPEELHPYLTKR
ncbi:hypothetical protein [Vibrio aestuarianus]|uniref:Uncharacterized protein n=1 Tax=Vibrio aestuarianus TaxID=28171 RepID=A0A9X4FEU1_9VIBR|nr:hypothetical protein [Vibrio aestuarianus]MDE1234972.1 hypothetical protein [Vibrio aestuarianus]MDE1245807.1 hypothetical protein [Vibrio aestuarianus]MDE1346812.1 hypothetical protein [Vibrio aestuarianus]NGZ66891.1 hypothetical protein [Vibrio aestuarianus subsp. cardii]